MDFVQNRLNVDINKVFDVTYLDAKGLFWAFNGTIPIKHSIYPIDIEKAKKFIEANYANKIEHTFFSSDLDKNTNANKFEIEELYFVF